MPIETTRPLTPGWWFARLGQRLADRQARLDELDDYYDGNPPLPEGAENCREAYRRFQRKARANFAALVVDAVKDRMQPLGFRTGAVSDDLGDVEAWRVWQGNSLDADAPMVHESMLAMSYAYVMVGGPDRATSLPKITPEDPRQVVTEQDPTNRRQSIAALKVWHDDIVEADVANLYLPGFVLRARRTTGTRGQFESFAEVLQAGGWEWAAIERVPLDVVPVVQFTNRPDLLGHGKGEFEDVTDILDRINTMVLQRLVIAAVQAFKQRAIKGELPQYDADGNTIDYNGLFRADPGALWFLPEGADLWESSQVDLTGILLAVRDDIRDLAAITRTPLFMLSPESANQSAEGASLAREGLVFKVRDRCAQAGESWEQVMSIAFAVMGDPARASRADTEVIWRAPESFSLTEAYDAASKAQAAGVPWSFRMRTLQFSPQEIERMKVEHDAETAAAPARPALPVAT